MIRGRAQSVEINILSLTPRQAVPHHWGLVVSWHSCDPQNKPMMRPPNTRAVPTAAFSESSCIGSQIAIAAIPPRKKPATTRQCFSNHGSQNRRISSNTGTAGKLGSSRKVDQRDIAKALRSFGSCEVRHKPVMNWRIFRTPPTRFNLPRGNRWLCIHRERRFRSHRMKLHFELRHAGSLLLNRDLRLRGARLRRELRRFTSLYSAGPLGNWCGAMVARPEQPR